MPQNEPSQPPQGTVRRGRSEPEERPTIEGRGIPLFADPTEGGSQEPFEPTQRSDCDFFRTVLLRAGEQSADRERS